MVHITDTKAQKVFSCWSAHITETVLAHDQHWEEQSSLSSPLPKDHEDAWAEFRTAVTDSAVTAFGRPSRKQSDWFGDSADLLLPAPKGAARGGAEGAQAPPLAIRILMFIS